jgi:hypothetical protein
MFHGELSTGDDIGVPVNNNHIDAVAIGSDRHVVIS